MPLTPLLLAAAMRCADPGYCPSVEELRSAIESYDWQRTYNGLTEEERGITEIFVHQPRTIADPHCGKPAGTPPAIACTATYHFADRTEVRTAHLVRTGRDWTMRD